MKLSTKGRYAVTAMVDLAYYSKSGSVKILEIAERQELPVPYLEQIFAKLKRADLVDSIRGPSGGYTLNRKPQDISIADIILAVEEPVRITKCQGDHSAPCRIDKTQCLTHDLWQGLETNIQTYLENITLLDIVEGRVKGIQTFMTSSMPLSLEQKRTHYA